MLSLLFAPDVPVPTRVAEAADGFKTRRAPSPGPFGFSWGGSVRYFFFGLAFGLTFGFALGFVTGLPFVELTLPAALPV